MTALLFYARHVLWLRFCPLLVACHGYAQCFCLSDYLAAFVFFACQPLWLRSQLVLVYRHDYVHWRCCSRLVTAFTYPAGPQI